MIQVATSAPGALLLFAKTGAASSAIPEASSTLFALPSMSIASVLYCGMWSFVAAEMVFFLIYTRSLPPPARVSLLSRMCTACTGTMSPVVWSLGLFTGSVVATSVLAVAVFSDPAVIADMLWGSITPRTDISAGAVATVAHSVALLVAAECLYFLCYSVWIPKHKRTTLMSIFAEQLFPSPQPTLLPEMLATDNVGVQGFGVVASTTGLLSLYYLLVPSSVHMHVCRFLLQLVSMTLAISAIYILSLP